MLAGLGKDAAARGALRLRPRAEYRYLGGEAGTAEADGAYENGLSEEAQWRVLEAAFGELGMAEELPAVLRVLSVVLLLGNVVFVDEEHGGTPAARVSADSRAALEDAAALVLCSAEVLEAALTVKKEDALFGRVPLNSAQAAKNADALAKALYAQLFGWLRDSINQELARAEGAGGAEAGRWGGGDGRAGTPTIGLLDIFGFESFAVLNPKTKTWVSTNSLEQLCINYANEALQMLFNTKVPEADRLLCLAE